ncbi:MAG: YeiH family protein [Rhodanobacteraceae bacterium]
MNTTEALGPRPTEQRASRFVALLCQVPGLALALGLGVAGLWLSGLPLLARWQVSALTLAIVFGMVLGNVFGVRLPAALTPGVITAQQKLLRLGVVLYGLRISFQQIAAVGVHGLIIDTVIVVGTLVLGTMIGRRLLGLDRHTAILVSSGSAVCGAAAVLAVERVLKPDPGKVAIAVATVVLFGTIDIFVYPWLFGYAGLDASQFGLFTGATVHEVAQVVAAGSAISPAAADTAVIVKLTRVMMLVPVLFALSWGESRGSTAAPGGKARMSVPWFALVFVAVAGVNSVISLPPALREALLTIDTLALAAAMAALGLETRVAKLKALGPRPLVLAIVLWLWLIGMGLGLTHLLA